MDYRTCKRIGRCEECEFYDYDDESDTYTCQMNLDQDDLADFLGRQTAECPYYRYYDEYQSIHNQI